MKHTKTAVISGAHGFIGQHLVKALQEKGIITGAIHRELLSQPRMLSTFFQQHQPNYIFHLASYGNLYDQSNVATVYDTNVIGLLNMLSASHVIDYEAFINVSSSSVTLPVSTIYSASKLAAESLCCAWVDQYRKPIITIRPYTVIGVNEHEQHLIPQLFLSCLTGKPIQFVPHPTHDFIDVEDVVQAMLLLTKYANKYKGEYFEVGSGKKRTNLSVLQHIEELTKKKAVIEVVESLRSYDNNRWMANTTALKTLGWKPTKSFEQTLKEMHKQYE